MSKLNLIVNNDPDTTIELPVQVNDLESFMSQSSGTIAPFTVTKTVNANYYVYQFRATDTVMRSDEFLELISEHGFPQAYGMDQYDASHDAPLGNNTFRGSVGNSYYYRMNKTVDPNFPSDFTLNISTQSNYGIGISTRGRSSYCVSLIAFDNGDDDFNMGFFTYYCWNDARLCEACIYIDRNYLASDGDLVVDRDPGSKGFKPTAARTTKARPGIGGRGTSGSKNPAYAGDHVEQPGAPDESAASAVKSGFLNCYKMTQSELNKVCTCLYSDTLLDAIKQLMVNPLDFIVSMMIFPCSPDVGASEAIKFGKWSCVATGVIGALGTDMSGARLSNQFKVFDFGTVTVPENWGNFLDYSQTSIELYLPFIGSVQLDPSECMGGTVNVQYTVDFFTGQCVANVYCHKYITLPSGMPIDRAEGQHSYQGNCAVQIPLSAVNYGSMIGSLINACTGSITNPTQPFSVLTDAAGGGFRPSVTSKGNVVANSGFCAVLYPYIRLLRPITAEPDSYQEVMGFPSYINTTLGECEDLCVCDGIDLKGISGATESELNRIRQLCSEGVYV